MARLPSTTPTTGDDNMSKSVGFPANPAPDLIQAGASLAEIETVAARCQSCAIFRHATQTVFGSGAMDASMVLVGEQPGDKEDLAGEPFVGPSGRLLDELLAEAGIDRDSAYVTNVVKHFKWKTDAPGSKPRLHAKPNRSEIKACRPWLDAELIRLDPAVVVCLGATAAQAMLGTGFRVTREHGHPIELDGRVFVATLHPAAVLRARSDEARDSQRRQMVEDLRVAAQVMAGGN